MNRQLPTRYVRQGNILICEVFDPDADFTFLGAACCNRADKWSDNIGQAIAFGRAMNERANFYAKYAFAN